MSKLTDFLKLFKYDPTTDKTKTFNITEALNNNWDKVDANSEKTADEIAKFAAQMLTKAKGNPQTGDALNAEKLGGVAAAKYATTETGTWTPDLYGTKTSGNPIYKSRWGIYVKCGGVITINAGWELQAKGGMSGNIKMRGLPAATKTYSAGLVASAGGLIASTSRSTILTVEISSYGEANFYPSRYNTTDSWSLNASEIADIFKVDDLCATYIVK